MSRRSLSILVALTMVLFACGGDSGGEDPQVTTTSPAQEPSETDSDASTTTAAAPAPEEPATTVDEGTGTATVGDTTWEFALSGTDGREMCNLDFSGFVLISMFGQDENGEEVALGISGSNSGGEAVVSAGITVISGEFWVADASVHDSYPAQSLPQEIGATVTVNGNNVSGSGVFYEDRSLNETRITGGTYETGVLEGTFSATCPAN